MLDFVVDFGNPKFALEFGQLLASHFVILRESLRNKEIRHGPLHSDDGLHGFVLKVRVLF